MAKPISGIPPFTGKAADWLIQYLDSAKPDPQKQEQAREDARIAKQMELPPS